MKRALDLFCGAGGATKGLQLAGFHVTGIDLSPQPNYCGDEFIQADALTASFKGFDFVWASPPCQRYTALKTMRNKRSHPDLIGPVRTMLKNWGLPWVIENVFGAPLRSPIMLCGSHFGLESNGFQLRRHRYFESNFPIENGHKCAHAAKTLGVYGAKVRDIAQEKRHYGKPKETRGEPVGVVLPQKFGFEAMQIYWMKIEELSEAIPPAYSRYIGEQFNAQH